MIQKMCQFYVLKNTNRLYQFTLPSTWEYQFPTPSLEKSWWSTSQMRINPSKSFPEMDLGLGRGPSSGLMKHKEKSAGGNFWKDFLVPKRVTERRFPLPLKLIRTACGTWNCLNPLATKRKILRKVSQSKRRNLGSWCYYKPLKFPHLEPAVPLDFWLW